MIGSTGSGKSTTIDLFWGYCSLHLAKSWLMVQIFMVRAKSGIFRPGVPRSSRTPEHLLGR